MDYLVWSLNEPIARAKAVSLQFVPLLPRLQVHAESLLYSVKCNNQKVLTDILNADSITLMTLAGIHIVVMLLMGIGMIVFRNFKAVKRSSPAMMIVMTVGALLGCIGVMLLALPATVPVCYLRTWFCGLGFVVFFSYVLLGL